MEKRDLGASPDGKDQAEVIGPDEVGEMAGF